jgi:hypothetical protein
MALTLGSDLEGAVTGMALRPERRDVTPLPDLLHGRPHAGPVRTVT